MGAIALQRSKAWLEKRGWHCWIVEHFNPWAHIRQDAYGMLDLIAIRHDFKGVWGVNATQDNGEVQEHVSKYSDGYDDTKKGRQPPNPHLPVWLSGNNRFSIFGWGKRASDGRGSRKVWTLRVVEAYLAGAQVQWKEVTPDPIETELPNVD